VHMMCVCARAADPGEDRFSARSPSQRAGSGPGNLDPPSGRTRRPADRAYTSRKRVAAVAEATAPATTPTASIQMQAVRN